MRPDIATSLVGTRTARDGELCRAVTATAAKASRSPVSNDNAGEHVEPTGSLAEDVERDSFSSDDEEEDADEGHEELGSLVDDALGRSGNKDEHEYPASERNKDKYNYKYKYKYYKYKYKQVVKKSDGDDEDAEIPKDSFSMFYFARTTGDYVLPICVFFMQMFILILIMVDLLKFHDRQISTRLNIPADVPGVGVYMWYHFFHFFLFINIYHLLAPPPFF